MRELKCNDTVVHSNRLEMALRGLAFYEGGVGLVEDGVIEGGRATWYGVRVVVLGFPRIFDKETDSEFSSYHSCSQ